jgi:hydrogenase maturation protease
MHKLLDALSTGKNRTHMTDARTLVAGIGSPHGDDQVGWLVAERITEIVDAARVRVRLLKTPANLLDWLDGVGRLVICDGFRGAGHPGMLRRWEWPDLAAEGVRWSGTHGVSLPAVLALAERLGQLPSQTIIWGTEIAAATPVAPLSDPASQAVSALVCRILDELTRSPGCSPINS